MWCVRASLFARCCAQEASIETPLQAQPGILVPKERSAGSRCPPRCRGRKLALDQSMLLEAGPDGGIVTPSRTVIP